MPESQRIRRTMNTLHPIDRDMLDALSAQAIVVPRRRKNYNLHASEQEPCNRLFNAIEPGSYIVPHRHNEPTKDETMVMVRGRMGVVTFDDQGNVVEHVVLEAAGRCLAVTIPNGVFHSLVALVSGSIFFEAKAGPYRPLQPDEKAGWAPAEGSPGATDFLDGLRPLFPA